MRFQLFRRPPRDSFDAWLADGLSSGFCGPAVCFTHDGLPTTETEDDGFYEDDTCIHVLRLYSDDITRKLVERNHPPSIWRKPR